MAVNTDPFLKADLQAIIPKIWAPMVLEARYASAVIQKLVTNLTDFAPEGDVISVPDLFTNDFVVTSRTNATDEVTTSSPAFAEVTITRNTEKLISFLIGKRDAVLISRSYDYNELLTRKAGKKLTEEFEKSLASLYASLTQVRGSQTGALTDAEIRKAINDLASQNFDVLNDGAFVFHPTTYYAQVLGIQKYYDASQFGTPVTPTGELGRLYGVRVYISTAIVKAVETVDGTNYNVHENLLLMPEAFGYAFFPGLELFISASWMEQYLSTLTNVMTAYGAGVMRNSAAVVVKANADTVV